VSSLDDSIIFIARPPSAFEAML